MLTKISFTFGSRQILKDIIDKNPDRQFKLMQASTHSHKLALFDFSGKETIFKTPVALTVLNESLNDNHNGILYYQSFQVNGDRQQLLYNTLDKIVTDAPEFANGFLMTSVANRNESSTLVLLSAWNDFEDLTAWRESDTFKDLDNFMTVGSDNYYYDEIYRPIA
ncbi:antibiotic biosynthesis monooxygenase [Limosilactobacillus sp.]|uniref:antibiotic biosynthesis monooxygenase n=1 Tax=Limosilactobacillus sp. TaxID=2773925 RepID=UPI0025BDB95F|nr:antibiotic biosynthesis monooxygenase [Limosilactobacillus sp.]MCH3922468.1 antibiotic biosynthesis monooxygenase [Limosilactobacillus sp.]MCH3927150.1 antibiotic biosynthesis monooxygenase [Limosilactobacillus sp.]